MKITIDHAPEDHQREFCELLNEIITLESCFESVTLDQVADKCKVARHARWHSIIRSVRFVAIESISSGRRLATVTV